MEADGLIVLRDGAWGLTEVGRERIGRISLDDVDGPDQLPFAVLTGPVVSGSPITANASIWDLFEQRGLRRVLALEMEAFTIAAVAQSAGTHCVVVKGVMDDAGLTKGDRFKSFAARSSAETLFALIGK